MRIRPMEMTDADTVAVLAGQLGYPSTADQVRQRLRHLQSMPPNMGYIAEAANGTIAGWIHVRTDVGIESDPHATIDGLVVDERHRSQGVGARLLAAAEQWVQEQGFVRIDVSSNIVRTRAHAFYQRNGYEIVKTSYRLRKLLVIDSPPA